MKKEALRAVLLLFVCSGFWVLTLALAASYFGLGFAQGQPPPYQPQGTVPPFGTPQFGTPLIHNNTMLANQSVATLNTTTHDVTIPFQVDTSRLLAFSVVVDNSIQTLTVLDPVNQSLVVYNIYLSGPDMGKCELKSARNISADLKYDSYQAISPLPGEVRAIVERAAEQKRQ